MAFASFQIQHQESLWSVAQIIIGFGTVACICCVLFLGLKLKWFRAQFKVEGMPKSKKSSETVQGIGFKIKKNSDDFQHYKSISEFATPETNLNNIPNKQNNHLNNGNHSNIPKKVTIMNEKKSNTESTSNDILNSTEIKESKKTLVDEYKNETEIKTSVEKKSKVSFAKNKAVQQNNAVEQSSIETVNVSSGETQQPIQNRNTVMSEEDEDNWNIRIVGEKPKVQIDNRNDDIYYEEIHLANNSSNSKITNSMYSSQAASIFFGSYDEKQPPDSPPPPIPRKFLEDQDTISMNSQTSA